MIRVVIIDDEPAIEKGIHRLCFSSSLAYCYRHLRQRTRSEDPYSRYAARPPAA